MKVVCVSDTHGLHDLAAAVPDGDVFVHAGDFTDTGERSEVLAFNEFLGRLPHRYKLVIAGNHESSFDRHFYASYWHHYGHKQQYDPDEVRALLTNALYLEDEAVEIEGYVFYGTPWQPEFCNWAFNLPRGDALLRQWKLIPTDTDVLITHTPPQGHGDLVGCTSVGCADLLHEVELRVRPKLHVFGHVHEGYGRSASANGQITYFNASACTHKYEPVNPPLVFVLTEPPKQGWHHNRPPVLTSSFHSSCQVHCSTNTSNSNSVSSQSIAEDEKVDVYAGPLADVEPRKYALMLHEWLRLCSHKPPFIETHVIPGKTCESNSRDMLRDFRVDGTTSGLLFESTLKLRPVINVQKRALRYLFAQGFQSNADNYKEQIDEDHAVAIHNKKTDEEVTSETRAESEAINVPKERRKYGISRRVTVAVLDDIDEDKEGMDERGREHVQRARLAAAALGKSDAVSTDTPPRGLRRNKTLQRRSAVPKLSPLSEDSTEGEESYSSTVGAIVLEENASEAAIISEAVDVAPSVSECALCKYNVHGHIHPGEEISGSTEAIVVAPRVAECVMCKYQVSGHVHPGAQALSLPTAPVVSAVTPREAVKVDTKPSKPRARADHQPSNHLSSWF
uniref:Calcineurin-like phosphoesterase domain-containing protein n=1 Tax=Hyaloperonospora arabidopsidis (strain Emoy2) TaxID=559515 RepID=M4BLI0_HYAAE